MAVGIVMTENEVERVVGDVQSFLVDRGCPLSEEQKYQVKHALGGSLTALLDTPTTSDTSPLLI